MISAIQKILELLIVKDQQNSPTVTLRGPQYWKENQQDIEVQNRDTDIIKYVCTDYGENVV